MINTKVYINKREANLASAINIADADEVQIEMTSLDSGYFHSKQIDVLMEDYKVPYTRSEDGKSIKTITNNLFRESFGYSNLRIFIDDEPAGDLVFNVSTNERKFTSIKNMMNYLLENNERMLDLCFSRTKYKSRNDGEFEASFDSVISLAEKIIGNFKERGDGLKAQLRHRLEMVKEDANGNNFFNINPYDIIDNLDKLHQGYSPDSVQLLGRVYSLDGVQRENYINSYDLEENKVLLGGLLSIREVLLDILNTIEKQFDDLTYDKEYEVIRPYNRTGGYVIEDLYAQITTSGMERRINLVLDDVNELLYFFQKEINVTHQGFHAPKLSPFARRSSFYLTAYRELNNWYSLGNPNIGVDHDLAKIKSTSKIYELFALYKIIDALHNDGWQVTSSVEHNLFKNFIPSQVGFKKEGSTLSVLYEKKINGFSNETKHNDLVALNKNNPRSQYNYYNPDFIIVKNQQDTVSYFVLDAKYSSAYTLEKHGVLDSLYDKYFSNLAVYNKDERTLDKSAIKSVNAIHPFGDRSLSKWPSYLPRIIPNVSSILLLDSPSGLDPVLRLVNDAA
ncbi:hypothetical protein [uncultured Psychrobacter sp.]|uniref:hypothetical protein n=1 Tax=uncultured Psychrobacter sp. TaxID=259303 RepID=UPI0030D7D277